MVQNLPLTPFILILVLFISPLVYSQESDSLLSLSLEELMQIKVTTSTKSEQFLWETPSFTTVVTRQQIESSGFRDLMDLLREQPYFQIQSEHGHWTKGGIINLRGHRSGDSGNNKFLILVDGVKISDDAEEGLYLGLNSIPLESVEQVEIVYGPNSTLYGRDAYVGMINLITRKENHSKAGFAAGSFNTQRAWVGLFRDFSEKVNGAFHLTHYRSDEQDPTQKSITYLNRHDFPQRPYTGIFYRASHNLAYHLALQAYGFTFRYIGYEIEGSETYGSNPDLYATEYSTVAAQRNHVLHLTHLWRLNKHLQIEWQAAHKKYEFEPRTANLYIGDLLHPFLPNSPDSLPRINPYYAYGGRKYYYFRTLSDRIGVKITSRFNQTISAVSGVEYQAVSGIPVISGGKGGKPITTDLQRDRLTHRFSTVGLFTDFKIEPTENFLLFVGSRFDINSTFDNTFMPRLAFVYHRGNHLLKLSLAYGYLAPSVTQKYFESLTTFSWIRPNNSLQPERNTSQELTWSYTQKQYQTGLNIFYNELRDGIQESVMTGDSATITIGEDSYYVPILESRNLTTGKKYGFTVWFTSQFFHHFFTGFNYNFLSGYDNFGKEKIKLSENLIRPHTFNIQVGYRTNKFILSGHLLWQSKTKIRSYHTTTPYRNLLDSEGYLNFKSVALFNLNARIKNILPGFSLFGYVKNLLNTEYYGQTINAAWGSPKILQDLRRITVGLEYEF
ncbi:MAG: hypothetical protein Kow0037_18570 [Calditrichia bacterium]